MGGVVRVGVGVDVDVGVVVVVAVAVDVNVTVDVDVDAQGAAVRWLLRTQPARPGLLEPAPARPVRLGPVPAQGRGTVHAAGGRGLQAGAAAAALGGHIAAAAGRGGARAWRSGDGAGERRRPAARTLVGAARGLGWVHGEGSGGAWAGGVPAVQERSVYDGGWASGMVESWIFG